MAIDSNMVGHTTVGRYAVIVQDNGKVHEYSYESIDEACEFLEKCSLACKLITYTYGRQVLIAEKNGKHIICGAAVHKR